jgi:hypothetical protein
VDGLALVTAGCKLELDNAVRVVATALAPPADPDLSWLGQGLGGGVARHAFLLDFWRPLVQPIEEWALVGYIPGLADMRTRLRRLRASLACPHLPSSPARDPMSATKDHPVLCVGGLVPRQQQPAFALPVLGLVGGLQPVHPEQPLQHVLVRAPRLLALAPQDPRAARNDGGVQAQDSREGEFCRLAGDKLVFAAAELDLGKGEDERSGFGDEETPLFDLLRQIRHIPVPSEEVLCI